MSALTATLVVYPNIFMNPYYLYEPPSALDPPAPPPQPPMPPPSLPQQQLPLQGQVYSQQSVVNPPNPKRRNKVKVNWNHPSQGNQGN